MRWTEEVELLLEEMRRVKVFFSWQAWWWETQMSRLPEIQAPEAEGVRAYAIWQSRMRTAMLAHCVDLWSGVPKLLETWKKFNRGHPVGEGRNTDSVNSA